MKAKNIFGENIDEIKSKFSQATSDGFSSTLAIVFCSIVQDRNELITFFTSQNVDIFGATTAGEILDDEVTEQSTVVMLLDIKKTHYQLLMQDTTHSSTYEACANLADHAQKIFNNPSLIVVSSGLTIDGEQIVKGVFEKAPQMPLYGGLAGDDLTMKATFVFNAAGEYSNAIMGLIIDGDKINVQGLATSGWDSIGIEKTITKSEGNVVYTIDDEPAVDVFIKYFEFKGYVDNRSEVVAMNFAQYPLQLTKENGNVVLRSPMMADNENRSLIFGGGIPQGSKVKFSVPPGFELVENTTNEISSLKTTIPEADAILMFSCKARHLALGPMTSNEAEQIRAIWDKPLIGFFTYGEIGYSKNSFCDFHNETCSMVILKEKN